MKRLRQGNRVKFRHHMRPQISLLVPFKEESASRACIWHWLNLYWQTELPDAEIIIGKDRHSHNRPFSKTAAINDAARRAHGDILVILDADAYVRGETIEAAARKIRHSLDRGYPLWYIPYRHIFRLTRDATERVLESDPADPERFPHPPMFWDVESMEGSLFGHHFGALIQILPREAFEVVGGMDHRFRGWGGEDTSFVKAVDTLYAKHKTLEADALHLWHPPLHQEKVSTWTIRQWAGQDYSRMNDNHASRYGRASGDYGKMLKLVNEGFHQGWLARIREWFRDTDR